MSTLEEMTEQALSRDPSQAAIEYDKRWLTWGDLRRIADQVNALIEASGAPPDAPVAMAPRNRPGAFGALLGLISRGRQIGMIHVYQAPAGLVRDIAKLKPAVFLAGPQEMSEEVIAALREQGVAGIVLNEYDVAAVPGLERSTADYRPLEGRPRIDLLTSGTTGPPKHYPLSYETLGNDIVGSPIDMSLTSDPATLPPMLFFYPFGNFSGIYACLPAALQGLRGVLIDRFNLDAWRDFVRRHKPSWAPLPTVALQAILDADVPRSELAGLTYIMSGAAPLDPTVHKAFEDKYDIPILLMYGATEFGGPVAFMTLDVHREWGKKKLGSVGRAFGGAQLRVVDQDTGEILPPGREGLLEVVAPRLGPDWLRTSDLVVLDADGFLWHRGRADGAIMRGGFKVLPDTIERALRTHEAVAAAGVTGVPDKRLGQVPGAAVQLKPGAPRPTIEELEAHLRQNVEATHIPTHWKFVDALPQTAMVKVDRAALKRLFETEAAQG
jgi:acyl-CoA synthetase (AMP-forming)/AMP-acid ligase II